MKKRLLFLFFLCCFGGLAVAQRTVSGMATNEKGEALIGATVVAKGTTVGTATDADGKYSLTVPAASNTLVFSYVGYLSREVEINGATTINAQLDANQVLQDVVIVGYGTQTKKELTGSVSKISGDAIQNMPTSNLQSILQGEAPGLQVTTNSGTPGGAVSIRVRGPSSISAGSQPLYVVDGIPVNSGSYAQLGTGNQTTDALADINPQDIESLEVLKDAAAASIYGSRASNGVILITTKRGKAGKTKISLNTYYGTQEAANVLQPITGPQYIALLNEERTNRGQSLLYPTNRPDTFPSTNWMSQIFRKAPVANTDISFSGGNENTKFYVAGGYYKQEGIVIGSSFQRYSLRANLDNRVTDNVRIGVSSYFSRSISNRINNDNNIYGVVSTAVLLGSHIPVRNPDGTYAHDVYNSVENPVAAAYETFFENPNNRLTTNIYAEVDLVKGLTFRTSGAIDYLAYREHRFYPTTTNVGAGVNGDGYETFAGDLNLLNENTLKYTKIFDNSFKLDLLGGLSFQHDNYESIFEEGQNFPGNTIKTLTAAAVKKAASSDASEWGINSQFARVNIGYAHDRYVLSGVVRRDGSSRFGTDKRYGVFPGISAAWNVIDEPFLKNNRIFSNVKLKAGWGRRGNSNIADFASRGLISPGYNYNQIAGLAPTQLGNNDLSWETREDLTAGIDLGFFQDRLRLTVEGYKAATNDLLLSKPVVYTTGFSGITQNVGSMENKGVDIGINADIVRMNNFTWTSGFNISFFTNKITKLVSPFAAGFASWVQEGEALGSFRGYRVGRIFQNQAEIDALNATAVQKFGAGATYTGTTLTKPGDIMFKDLNGDGRITSDDQEILGTAQPKYWGGFTNSFKFMGFDASILFTFTQGNYIYNNTRAFSEGMNGVFGQTVAVLSRWTPDNPSTTLPRAVYGDPSNNRRTSDRWLEDGSYIRLKSVSIGYNVPGRYTKMIGLSGIRVYAMGQNLWTKTNYSGFDPEVSTFAEGSGSAANTAAGTDFLTFPQAKTYTFGLNVSFQ